MTQKIYDCDNNAQWDALKKQIDAGGHEPGALPRKTKYGDPGIGLKPVGDYPDELVDPKDFEEVIAHSHKHKMFPIYHQYKTWCPPGDRWTQNGTKYCWAWSGVGDLMDLQAREGKRKEGDDLLAPITMGWLVNWRNAGNYLEDLIRGLKERGVAPMSCVPDQHSRNHRAYADDWEEQAMKNRLDDDGVFDCSPRNMLQHALTVLATGTPLYSAWNRMSHAMSVVGLVWDESKYNNVIWIIRNSHNEDDVIEMHGRNAVPDEAFGFSATKT